MYDFSLPPSIKRLKYVLGITVKVLAIFTIIVTFSGALLIQKQAQLAKCIAVFCNLGFSPTMQEIIVSIMI